MTRIIKDTVDHVIQHDKEELSDLLMLLWDEVGKEFLDALLDLELLSGKFRIDEFQEVEPLLPLIEERRLKLEAAPASFSKLLSAKMLLSDINNNCRRVQELFPRIDDAEDNEEDIWKLLARQGLISDELFEKLSKLDNTDIETIASVLKAVKICQGIPFSLKGLSTIFGALRTEFIKNGSEMMKNKLLPVLKEPLHHGGIMVVVSWMNNKGIW